MPTDKIIAILQDHPQLRLDLGLCNKDGTWRFIDIYQQSILEFLLYTEFHAKVHVGFKWTIGKTTRKQTFIV